MGSVVRAAFALLAFLSVAVPAAHADKRAALVIGNSAYRHTAALPNPRNDAGDVAAALRSLGFEVVEGFDLDKAGFDRAVKEFARVLEGAQVGVFFYAGHGLQVAGQNYLVPVDAELKGASGLDFEMVRLDLIQRTMENEAKTNILFLDACRDNPLSRNLARAMGTRSAGIGRGLATVESGVGTLISFSTQPGNVALDGAGRNSPFAKALAENLVASDDDLSAILISVRNDVMKETQSKQIPWEHSALTGRFYFKAPTATAPAAPVATPVQPGMTPAPLSEAAEAWSAAKDTSSPAVLEAFISRYGQTFYADLARARLGELKAQTVASAAPTPPPPSSVPAPAPAAAPAPTPMPREAAASRSWTLGGGKTFDLLGGKLSFTMIGTPHGARRDLVGVRVNGQTTTLAVGGFVRIVGANQTCGIFLTEIHVGKNAADFRFICPAPLAGARRDRSIVEVSLIETSASANIVTMSAGTTRQFEPGNVLVAFVSSPYGARRDLVGVRIQGKATSMGVGQRVEVPVGSSTCYLALREIHLATKSAEFSWQC